MINTPLHQSTWGHSILYHARSFHHFTFREYHVAFCHTSIVLIRSMERRINGEVESIFNFWYFLPPKESWWFAIIYFWFLIVFQKSVFHFILVDRKVCWIYYITFLSKKLSLQLLHCKVLRTIWTYENPLALRCLWGVLQPAHSKRPSVVNQHVHWLCLHSMTNRRR